MLVLGDAMADWLGYGLEDAYAEQPDMGVIRKHKTISGLIKYQPRGEPADWTAAAKGILATEKPDAIVVMLGLNDRVSIREAVTEKKTDKKDDKKDARGKPGDAKPKPESSTDTAKPDAGKADAPRRMEPRRTLPRLIPRPIPRRLTMPRTMMRRKPPAPEKSARAAAGSTSFAMSAGSNSTPRRSKS